MLSIFCFLGIWYGGFLFSPILSGCYLQESSEFHKRSFECAVDSIRAIAASHLWQVMEV